MIRDQILRRFPKSRCWRGGRESFSCRHAGFAPFSATSCGMKKTPDPFSDSLTDAKTNEAPTVSSAGASGHSTHARSAIKPDNDYGFLAGLNSLLVGPSEESCGVDFFLGPKEPETLPPDERSPSGSLTDVLVAPAFKLNGRS